MRMISDAAPEAIAQSVVFCCRDCRAQFFAGIADIWAQYPGVKELMSEAMDEDVDAPDTWDELCKDVVDRLSLQEQDNLANAIGQLWFRLKEQSDPA
jgi:hypothetical protein